MNRGTATTSTVRALAPDIARGGMLLLIALANVHLYLTGRLLGVRGYPAELDGADQAVALVQLTLVDGRAYPLFGLLFGYGIVQLSRRYAERADEVTARKVVRRRGWWMLAIGLVHGVLLFSGDIVGAYGVLAVLLAGVIVRGGRRPLLVVAVVGVLITAVSGAGSGLPVMADVGPLGSMASESALSALLARVGEWLGIGVIGQAFGVVAAVAIGALLARSRVLDEPGKHLRALRRMAVLGVGAAVIGGLPLAGLAAGAWGGDLVEAATLDPTAPENLTSNLGALLVMLGAGILHSVGGYAGGVGYAALFGLIAARVISRHDAVPGSADTTRPVRVDVPGGVVIRALRAVGQRSLSCYLAQSVVFVALLPAWTLGLGSVVTLWQASLIAAGTWLLILFGAVALDARDRRGPAEVLLRRLTYGPPAANQSVTNSAPPTA